jgi:hypothetical protein
MPLIWGRTSGVILVVGWILGQTWVQAEDSRVAQKKVLVELFTSQGCDYCPEAERTLGMLAEMSDRIIPIAFHVDYFNDPWVDPFSASEHSQRQMAYNNVYQKPKPEEYGLYYTPMLMIDGEQSVNGRDRRGAAAVIRQAFGRKPGVRLQWDMQRVPETNSVQVELQIAARTARAQGRKLLVGVAVVEDRVETYVESGENARKTYVSRYPARRFERQFTTLQSVKPSSLTFELTQRPEWNAERLKVVVFVQDDQTGLIHQADSRPWPLEEVNSPSQTGRKSSPRR